mmetsp:Transcript_8940/g.37558  ORF Transcript_8940/g.37558 Transcript_8940/m.37558 type:complete len:425 (+) Transcript_8940:1917-3191(+)
MNVRAPRTLFGSFFLPVKRCAPSPAGDAAGSLAEPGASPRSASAGLSSATGSCGRNPRFFSFPRTIATACASFSSCVEKPPRGTPPPPSHARTCASFSACVKSICRMFFAFCSSSGDCATSGSLKSLTNFADEAPPFLPLSAASARANVPASMVPYVGHSRLRRQVSASALAKTSRPFSSRRSTDVSARRCFILSSRANTTFASNFLTSLYAFSNAAASPPAASANATSRMKRKAKCASLRTSDRPGNRFAWLPVYATFRPPVSIIPPISAVAIPSTSCSTAVIPFPARRYTAPPSIASAVKSRRDMKTRLWTTIFFSTAAIRSFSDMDSSSPPAARTSWRPKRPKSCLESTFSSYRSLWTRPSPSTMPAYGKMATRLRPMRRAASTPFRTALMKIASVACVAVHCVALESASKASSATSTTST